MKGLKIILSTLLTIAVMASLLLDAIYITLLLSGEEKHISNTYNVGLQQDTSGNTNYFCEVNYFSNAKKNGYEMLEVKFNYFTDENQDTFFAQGMQFVGKNNTSNITREYVRDNSSLIESRNLLNMAVPLLNAGNSSLSYSGSMMLTNCNISNYSYFNNVATYSTNPLVLNNGFKVQLGEDLFIMKFKGDIRNEDTLVYSKTQTAPLYQKTSSYYFAYDVHFFITLLENSIQTIKPGSSSAILFEFGDLFDYYKYNTETKSYELTNLEETALVKTQMKSYYTIKASVNENGARRYSDSIFNCINGNSNWVYAESPSEDYFFTRSLIQCNELDFELIDTETNGEFKLRFNENFTKQYWEYRNDIVLDIDINLQYFKKLGATIVGFTDNCFENFKVYESNIKVGGGANV